MAHNNIDERFRKPRRAKGTPFYSQRNYLTIGVCLVSGLTWYIYELLPQTKILKKNISDGKYEDPAAIKDRLLEVQIATSAPELKSLLSKVRERKEEKADGAEQKEETGKPMPWYIKMFSSTSPDVGTDTGQISKYFRRTATTDLADSTLDDGEIDKRVKNESKCDDSPYKSSLKEISCQVNDSLSDEKDFMSPLVIKKRKEPTNRAASAQANVRPRQRQTREKKKTFMFQKKIEDTLKNLDMNPDHLQMAIALSESAHSAENAESQEKSYEESCPLVTESQQKSASLRSTLEQFGFRSGGVKSGASTWFNTEIPKKRKKSKFTHVTPTLLLRTEEDREAIITSKVSVILSKVFMGLNITKPQTQTMIFCSKAIEIYNCQAKNFSSINSKELAELNDELFYTKSLRLPVEKSCCGCLLKNWSDIPGRETTPPRKIQRKLFETSATVGEIVTKETKISSVNDTTDVTEHGDYAECSGAQVPSSAVTTERCVRRSISPDIFCDDDEFPESAEKNVLPSSSKGSFSKYTLEEFEDDNGICHFESFYDDEMKLSQEKLTYLADSEITECQIRKNNQEPMHLTQVYDLTLSSDEEVQKTSKEITFSHDNETELPTHERNSLETQPGTRITKTHTKFCSEEIISTGICEKEEVDQEKQLDCSEKETEKISKEITFCQHNKIEIPTQKGGSLEKHTGRNVSKISTRLCSEKSIIAEICEYEVDEETQLDCRQSDSSILVNNKLSSDDTEMKKTVESSDDDAMNEDTIILDNSFSNLKLPSQEVVGSNRFSVNFDLNFSNETSLNITTYINDMLNQKSFNISKESSMKESEKVNAEVVSDLKGSPIHNKNETQLNHSLKHLAQDSDEFPICSSQASSQEVQHISDEELDYSSNFRLLSTRKSKVKKKLEYNEDYTDRKSGTLPADDVIVLSDDSKEPECDIQHSEECKFHEHCEEYKFDEQQISNGLLDDSVDGVLGNLNTTLVTNHINHIVGSVRRDKVTPDKSTEPIHVNTVTPKNTLIIKTDNVTPMPNYDNMDTPKIAKELDKFGVKPLKRQRGVQLLKYIYESTHPVVGPQGSDCSEDENEHRKFKKRKKDVGNSSDKESEPAMLISEGFTSGIDNVEIVGDIVSPRENIGNLTFERRQSTKIASCRIPLDIVWHNFISANKQIRENMLLYQPLQLEVLHNMLKEIGFKFHIQDLLTFLDRKCITVRVASSQGRGKRK